EPAHPHPDACDLCDRDGHLRGDGNPRRRGRGVLRPDRVGGPPRHRLRRGVRRGLAAARHAHGGGAEALAHRRSASPLRGGERGCCGGALLRAAARISGGGRARGGGADAGRRGRGGGPRGPGEAGTGALARDWRDDRRLGCGYPARNHRRGRVRVAGELFDGRRPRGRRGGLGRGGAARRREAPARGAAVHVRARGQGGHTCRPRHHRARGGGGLRRAHVHKAAPRRADGFRGGRYRDAAPGLRAREHRGQLPRRLLGGSARLPGRRGRDPRRPRALAALVLAAHRGGRGLGNGRARRGHGAHRLEHRGVRDHTAPAVPPDQERAGVAQHGPLAERLRDLPGTGRGLRARLPRPGLRLPRGPRLGRGALRRGGPGLAVRRHPKRQGRAGTRTSRRL
ncbi:MAG: hypothetical protein AVDCRST_MAG25-3700, partial [uncultured Rubrobacteraceae bacterium]